MNTFAFIAPAQIAAVPPSTPMLLALSGGADSRLLLHLVAETAARDGAPLHLAHVHHGIRGEEADRDEAFCRTLAERYGLPIYVLYADVPAIARESGETLEQAARRVRYDYFATLMREHRIPMLLTAHHATDNMETVLFRLCRGTGLSGLGGIAPVRPFEAVRSADMPLSPVVVRPLLGASREDVAAACEQLGLDYVTDSTNADTAYARNRIRAEVLPALAAVVDHPEQQVLRLCETLREDEQLLCSLADELLNAAWQGDTLSRSVLAAAHPSLSKRALRRWLEQQTGRSPEAVHLGALLTLCNKDATGRTVSLGGAYAVTAERDCLRICPDRDDREDAPPDYCLALTEGEHDYPDIGLHVRMVEADKHAPVTTNSNVATNVYNPFIRDTLTFDTIIPCVKDATLTLRPRRPGDVLLKGGMHRKIRKLQNEQGIPATLRNRLPLLCDGEGVLWAPAVGLRDTAQTNPDTVHYHLTITLTLEHPTHTI